MSRPRSCITSLRALVAAAALVTGIPRPGLIASPQADPEVVATIDQLLASSHHPQLRWPDFPDVAPALRSVYEAEPDRLFWFDGARPHPSLAPVVAALERASEHGLDPADYDAATLAAAWRNQQAGPAVRGSERALFDIAVSVATVRLVSAVQRGRVDPAVLGWGYRIDKPVLEAAEALHASRDGTGLVTTLAEVQPPLAHYTRAMRTLADYKALAAAGEPLAVPLLPRGQKVEPGKPWAGLRELRARLLVLGDLPRTAPAELAAPDGTPLHTGAIVDAVRRFQWRHVLEADGVIGAGTIAALDVPIAHRVRQVELAMERMRWLPDMHDKATVFVNVPLYRLWATDPSTGEEPLRMNVVVGKAVDHHTPIFIDQMEYVIFRPYWNPPRSIVLNELLPKARKNPGYLDREELEIVASGADDAPALPVTPENLNKVAAGALFVRQKPGPRNSLGLAKFIFPNDENVYMHGTPAQALFSRVRRDFSHGCIRLEDAARFAEWELRDQKEWTRTRIDQAMQAGRPLRVNLTSPPTVVIFYDTVHVNSEAVVFFAEDIYGHDRALDEALRRGYPYPTKP
jgi:murein L,D-transpeptidase YcbB/YkuD